MIGPRPTTRRQFLTRTGGLVAGLGVGTGLLGGCARADNRNILRVVPYADLQALDPVVTTAGIVQRHALMVYDFLFGRDAAGVPQPQMVAGYDRSTNGLDWQFTLREGLAFHDGAPVTPQDVIASLRRWATRDAYGRQIMAVTQRIEADGPRGFVWRMSRPYGLLLEALSKTGGPVPAIMPRRIAQSDAGQPIRDPTGSGPFRFNLEQWVPGGLVVYDRNADYVPRDEPASATAGGKRVHVDRVEWHNIRDPQSAILALLAGEVDYVENPTPDFLPMLDGEDIWIERKDPLGTQGMLRMNHLHPPFDRPEAREALLWLVDQRRYLQAMFGNPDITQACRALFVCGSPLASDAGVLPGLRHDPARARALFAAAGYDGRPLVILHPTDIQFMNIATLVLADDLRSIGVKVDLQAMDFGAMAARRANRAAPEAGGWHLGMTYWPGMDVADPVANTPMQASCDAAWPGWPCDAAHQALIDAYPYAADAAERTRLAAQIQASAYRLVPYVPIGLWFNPVAYRSMLNGVLSVPGSTVYWNIRKQAAAAA